MTELEKEIILLYRQLPAGTRSRVLRLIKKSAAAVRKTAEEAADAARALSDGGQSEVRPSA